MKKLFLLSLVIFSISQSSFAWSPFIWRQKPKPACSNTEVDKKVDQLGRKVSGVKQNVTELDNKVNSLDQKVTEIDNEVVKIGQDVTKIDQKTTELDQKVISLNQKTTTIEQNVTTIGEQVTEIGQDVQTVKDGMQSNYDQLTLYVDEKMAELPGTKDPNSSNIIPFTVNGKYIGNVFEESDGITSCRVSSDSKHSCVWVSIDQFEAVRILSDGIIDPRHTMSWTFFTQPNCEGNVYTYAMVPQYVTGYLYPPLKGKLFDINDELYYYAKNSQVMKTTQEQRKSVVAHPINEEYYNSSQNYQYAGNGRCYNTIWTAPNDPSDSIIYVHKLSPNDPAVTGIDEYPFKGEILIDGRPLIDLSQVPVVDAEEQ